MFETERSLPTEKYIVALTGGIASGKTLVADTLKELGASIIDTDIISREIVEPGSPVIEQIRQTWGDDMLNPDGTLNRVRMADLIFTSDTEREKLNRIMHPEIRRKMLEDIEEIKSVVAIIVIPLLFEADIPIYYDEAWVVYCPPSMQKERLIKRNNLTPEEAQKRINSQYPIDRKVEMADVVIDNSDTEESVKTTTRKEWEKLRSRLAADISNRLPLKQSQKSFHYLNPNRDRI
jgi:dephospho-CoA kinase